MSSSKYLLRTGMADKELGAEIYHIDWLNKLMKKEVANPSNIISYKRGCLLSIGLTQLCQFEYTAYNLFYILIGHSYWLSSKKQRYLEVKVRFLGCPPNIPNPRSAQLACEWLDTTMGPSEQREFKLIKQFNKACKVPGRAR